MNKFKKQIINSSIILVVVLIIAMLLNSSIAVTIDNANTVDQLIECTRSETWYDYDPTSQISKNVTTPANFNNAGGYCVDSHARVFQGTYKVVNIIDVNNNTSSNTIKIYGENGYVKEYPFSDPSIKPVLMLAYLAQKGNNETTVGSDYMYNSYKAAMPAVFLNYSDELKSVGFSDYLEPRNEGWGTSSQKYQEAIREAEKLSNQGNLTTGNFSIAMTDDEKANISATVGEDGKYYIGPYKINITGGAEVGEIQVNGKTAAGISTDMKKVKGFDKVKDNKEFYVVLDEQTEIKNVKIIGKDQVNSIKARILIVSGGASQNFMIYRAEETPQNPEIDIDIDTPEFGELSIIKESTIKNKNVSLKDIGFVVWSRKQKAYINVNNGKIEYVDFETAKKNEFKTDKNGKVEKISNLPLGKYEVYETSIPDNLKDYFELPETTLKDTNDKKVKTTAELVEVEVDGKSKKYVSVKAGQTAKVTATNYQKFVPVVLEKVDKKTGKPLKGIEFKLFSDLEDKKGWVTVNSNNEVTGVTDDWDEAASFVTKKDGLTDTIRRVPLGNYMVYETGLGEYEGIYEDLEPIRIYGGNVGHNGLYKRTVEVTVETNEDDVFKIKAENEQVYINISGFVWEDQKVGKNEKVINGLLDGTDYMINGIEVKLVDKDGNVIQTTKTAYDSEKKKNGAYTFKKVKIKELSNYHVEFTYDGITYQSVVTPSSSEVKLTDEKTSKASETTEARSNLNHAFTELTGEGQTIKYNNDEIEVTYNKQNNGENIRVIPNNICDRNNGLNYESQVVNLTKSGNFTLESITKDKYLSGKYSELEAANPDKLVTEISNVNLGLYVREQPNLALVKDVSTAQVSVNGKTYEYNYERRIATEGVATTVGVIFERKNPLSEDLKYKTPIYRADAAYESEDKSKELKVAITYKVGLVNNSSNLYGIVNSINETYSKELEFVKMYKLDNDKQELMGDSIQEKVNGDYKTFTFDKLNIRIEPQTTQYIYLTFNLPKEQIYNIQGQQLRIDKEFANYAEIASYTVCEDKFTSLYAGFDTNSIPNNLDVNRYEESVEDDSDKAPTLRIEDAGQRTLEGIVFEDSDKDETDQERIGDGKFDNENKIANVKVRLVDTNGNEVKVYDTDRREFVEQTSITNENGEYTISGFIPGDYIVQYTWGEGEGTVIKNADNTAVTVDSYKSTIWSNESIAEKQNAKWYLQTENRYSDAKDDYDLRQKYDSINSSVLEVLNSPVDDMSKVQNKAQMKSNTPTLDVGIEMKDYEEVLVGDTPIYKFNIVNVDLGLIERPRQTIELEKHVDSFKLVTDARQTIMEAKMNDEGQFEVQSGSVTGGPSYGYVRGETDADILNSGTSAIVSYKITLTNTSEKDYASSEYYYYGNKDEKQLIGLKTTALYDYLSGLNTDVEANTSWKNIQNTEEDAKAQTITQVLADKVVENSSSSLYSFTTENGETLVVEETMGDKTTETITEYIEEMENSNKKFKNLITENKIISKYIENGNEAIELKPGESKEINYYGETLLSSSKDIIFENDVEVADVQKTKNSGRSVDVKHSNFYTKSEWITITPPTGEDKNYTPIIILAISSIAIIGAGVVFIKKIVLK